MIFTGVSEIRTVLASVNSLSESLLVGVRLVNHGYSAVLGFELVVDSDGELLEGGTTLWIALEGVLDMHLRGGLTDSMRSEPGSIDSGLSEVALVEIADDGDAITLRCRWEGQRSLTVRCGRVIAAWTLAQLRAGAQSDLP